MSPIQAFSAKLARPWEDPLIQSRSLTRRRQRWDGFTLQSTSIPDDTTAEGSIANTEHDEEDIMLLQNSNDSTSEVITSVPHANITAESLTEPTKAIEHGSTLKIFFGMTRPSNFPGVVLLHVLGVYLALQSPHVENAQLLPTLARPSMMIVLSCLLLTSAASMMVNDYFDNKIGIDSDVRKPLVGGTVTMAAVKSFLYYIYQVIALLLTAVPGVPSRLMVVIGNMITYWYTKHLKPVTWLKNVVCAAIIGLSPATSGAAAFHLLSTENSFKVFGVSALSRLVTTLFLGFTGREILMDINDVKDDAAHNVKTVPVTHGLKFASTTALLCTAAMAACALAGPLWKIGQSLGDNSYSSCGVFLSTLVSSSASGTRQLILGSLGCFPMFFRAWNVYKTEGEDRALVDQAVNEGKLTFVLILASFI